MKVYAYADGASRGNPGLSASGYWLLDESHRLIFKRAFYNGKCTNNVAEYMAVIEALRKALELLGPDAEVVLVSDSRLVISQIAGKYKVRSPNLKALNEDAKVLLGRFRSHRLLNVRRENEYVSKVDADLNELLDSIEEGGADTAPGPKIHRGDNFQAKI
ncbi:Ribonuclease HI [uncultured archaeon]|nr:Ribonuclease HI [uncultured archaeon]